MMKLPFKNLRQSRRFSADNKEGTCAKWPGKGLVGDCVGWNKTGRKHGKRGRQQNSHMSRNIASRDPYFYRSRAAHLQVNMGDISTNVNRDCRKPRDHFELKSKSIKLRSETTQKLKSLEVKISGRDNLKDLCLADVKLESSTDSLSDDSCTAWNSKAKRTSVDGENKPKSVHRQLRDRHRNKTKVQVQDPKFSFTLRQHPYRRPKRNIVPKKEAAYGLLWKEEAALQKALNASIQAPRHKELSTSQPVGQPRLLSENKSPNSQLSNNIEFDAGEDYAKTGESEIMDEDFGHNFTFIGSDVSVSKESKDGRARVRAQRKFASSSQLDSLNVTPVKLHSGSQSQKILNTNGKTEHFLTFLCLRRSSFLPPHLECFKHGESDSLASFPSSPPGSHGGSSCPGTPASLPVANDVNIALMTSLGTSISACTSPAKDTAAKQTGSKQQNNVKSNSQRSLMFGLKPFKATVEGWRAGQRKMIKGMYQQTSGAKIPQSSLTSSLSSRPQIIPDLLEHRKQPASNHQFTRQRSQLTLGVSRLQGQRSIAKVDTSLKSRLRDSTKALTAAVVKEQLMVAKRLQEKQMMTSSDEEDEEEEPEVQNGSVRVTRSHSLPLNRAKTKLLGMDEMVSGADKISIKDKKEKAEGRIDSSERRHSISQSTKRLDRPLPFQSTKHTHTETSDNSTEGKSFISSSATFATTSLFSTKNSLATAKMSRSVGEVPTFHPTREELDDFTLYISDCNRNSKEYGMCRIIPPDGWKMDCNISQELRFTPQTQYIHKMTCRWGPNVQQLTCIMHHIESQGGSLEHFPLVGGVETDMVALSQAVVSCGGIQQVIDKNKWPKVAEMLRIPTVAKEKSGRLYEIYCRYLLSYDTLSAEEKKKLEEKVLNKRERDPSAFDQSCVVKSRAKTLSEFFCVARNTQSMYFDEDPSPAEIQDEYWKLAEERKCHVAVQTGHIDSWQLMSTRSSLSRKKDPATSKDGSNLKSLIRKDQSLLCHLEPISGVTEPVLDIGMLFSTLCWSRDPHFLPRLYYLHTGSDVIWYSVPASDEGQLKAAMRLLTPDLIDSNLSSWLPTESVMISPTILERHGVHVYQTIQQQGQFIVIFPESFAANISCGYNIMEHINFTFTPEWLQLGYKASQILKESCEPELFSVEKLLVDLVTKEETSLDVLKIALPLLEDIVMKELDLRRQLLELGLTSRRLSNAKQDLRSSTVDGGCKSGSDDLKTDCDLRRCDVSEKLCFLSMVFNEQNDVAYSLDQAVSRLKRRKNLSPFALLYKFDEFELSEMIEKGQLKVTGRRRSPSKRNAAFATKYRNRTL